MNTTGDANGSGEADKKDDEDSRFFDPAPLRKMRKALRLTQLELANLLGIHRTYLVLIEKGKKIPSPRLQRFIDEFIYKAEKEAENRNPLSISRTFPALAMHPQPLTARRVPVVSWAAAGEARDYQDLANQIDEYVETNSKDPNAFSVIVEGDSMENKFYAGDRVVFAPNLEPRNGDAVLAKLNDGRVFFKWYHRTGPEGIRIKLSSENPNYSPMEFAREELSFIYPAWEVKRFLRRG
jgi:SOS-response transcriptional repressor LexA